MPALAFSRQAEQDLDEIFDFIARDSLERAIAFSEELQKACLARAGIPKAGKQEVDLPAGVLWFPYADYVFYYRIMPMGQGIRILRVFHGARNHRAAMTRKLGTDD